MSDLFEGSQLCAQTDPELFFNFETKSDAIKICNRCPVFSACKQYAESAEGLYGVWAGKWYNGSGYRSSIIDKRVVLELS